MFSITTDDLALIKKLIMNTIENSDAMRVAVRRVGTKWKAIGREIAPNDADLLVPLNADDTR